MSRVEVWQELAALRLRIRAIETGEEAARLRRILESMDHYPDESESSIRSRLAVLSTQASREHLLDGLRHKEAQLAREAAAPAGSVEPRPTLRRAVNAPPAGQEGGRDGLQWDAASAAALAGLVGIVIGLVIASIGFYVLNGDADKHIDQYWLLRAGIAASILAMYAGIISSIAEGQDRRGPRWWTVLLATGVFAVPVGSTWNEWVSLGLLVPASFIGGVILWLGNRRAQGKRRSEWVPRFAFGTGTLAIGAVSVALLVLPHPGGSVDPTPERLDGTPSYEFEQDDLDRAEDASDAVKDYCADAVSEAQRIGCESHVTEEEIP